MGRRGKGKIVDALTAEFDLVVRFQGGANAGHTVKIDGVEHVFHLIPSGIMQDGKICVIGNGVVLDPRALIEELDGLRDKGLDRESSVWISDRAHVVINYHRAMDAAREGAASSGRKIGTTLRGIGPCYTDKAARQGVRVLDLVDPDRLRPLLERNVAAKNRELSELFGAETIDLESTVAEYEAYGERLRPLVRDVAAELWNSHRDGKRMLFEGAQGALLDLDMGTYPFVTSSNTSFLGLGSGTGFSPRRVGTVFGVVKAYCTRVGAGPFPSEDHGEAGEELRRVGGEFGATTGRPRRCGWLDVPAVRYAVEVGDVDALVITKLDVLDGINEIPVAVGYERRGKRLDRMPTDLDEHVRPVYETVSGWNAPTTGCRRPEDLPAAARDYLQYIADRVGCPIAMVSVGKERSAMFGIDPWLTPRG